MLTPSYDTYLSPHFEFKFTKGGRSSTWLIHAVFSASQEELFFRSLGLYHFLSTQQPLPPFFLPPSLSLTRSANVG